MTNSSLKPLLKKRQNSDSGRGANIGLGLTETALGLCKRWCKSISAWQKSRKKQREAKRSDRSEKCSEADLDICIEDFEKLWVQSPLC